MRKLVEEMLALPDLDPEGAFVPVLKYLQQDQRELDNKYSELLDKLAAEGAE